MAASDPALPAAGWLRRRGRALGPYLGALGPGVLTAIAGNEAGGITTETVAGARYGYALLWTLVPMTAGMIVVQEMAARMGAVTGKGLSDLIREQYGVKATFTLMIGLAFANLSITASNFAGIAAAGELAGLSRYLVVPMCALGALVLVISAPRATVEKVFLGFVFFYLAYIVSGALARPDWGRVAGGVLPEARADLPYLTLVMALLGTTITPWMQFSIQSAIVEKGVRAEEYRFSRVEVIAGCIVTNVIAFFVIVTCAATLWASGMRDVRDAADAARALAPLAREHAALLFGIGYFGASLFGASFVPTSTAFYVCEGFGWESGVGRRFREAPQFFTLLIVITVTGASLSLIPGTPLIRLIIAAQVVNGVLLPFILLFMLKLVNRRDLMGARVNGPVANAVAWGTVVVLMGLTLGLAVLTLLGRV